MAVAGGLSLCSLSRQGATVPAAKYHEGTAAALAEARRACPPQICQRSGCLAVARADGGRLDCPVLLGLMVAASGVWPGDLGWVGALVAMVALSCAITMATYLRCPGTGLRLDLGCTPCAAVAAVTVLASFGPLSSAPHDASTAVLALGVSAFRLVQRLNNPSTCPT